MWWGDATAAADGDHDDDHDDEQTDDSDEYVVNRGQGRADLVTVITEATSGSQRKCVQFRSIHILVLIVTLG